MYSRTVKHVFVLMLVSGLLLGIGANVANGKPKEVKVEIHTVKGGTITEEQVREWIKKTNEVDAPEVKFVVDSNHVYAPNSTYDPNKNDGGKINIWGLEKCEATGEPNYVSGQTGNVVELVPGKKEPNSTNVFIKDSTLAHELNHALGLEHSIDPNNKMYPDNHPDANGVLTSCHRKGMEVTAAQRAIMRASKAISSKDAVLSGFGAEKFGVIGNVGAGGVDLYWTQGWLEQFDISYILHLTAQVNYLSLGGYSEIEFYIESDGDAATGEGAEGLDYHISYNPESNSITFEEYDGGWVTLSTAGIGYARTYTQKDSTLPFVANGIAIELPIELLTRRGGGVLSYSVIAQDTVEVDVLPEAGLLSMAYPPLPVEARNPNPPDSSGGVGTVAALLCWEPGIFADVHTVYFGTDPAFLNLYSYEQMGTCIPLPPLEHCETYYWQVNEVNEPNEWVGDVWSFTVRSMIPGDFDCDDDKDYADLGFFGSNWLATVGGSQWDEAASCDIYPPEVGDGIVNALDFCAFAAGHWLEDWGGEDCCPSADFNSDGLVNMSDLTIFISCFGGPPVGPCEPCDLNCDGWVDQIDQTLFECQFNPVGPPNPPCCP